MSDQQSDEEGIKYQCDYCDTYITFAVRYHCTECDDADFCQTCVKRARKEEHTKHRIIVCKPSHRVVVRRKGKRDSTTVAAAAKVSSTKPTAVQQGDDRGVPEPPPIPQSLIHLEKAQLYFGHGNTHTNTHSGPFTDKIKLISDFKLAHYPADRGPGVQPPDHVSEV